MERKNREREWHASEQFLDFLLEEGHLQDYEKEGKDTNLLIDEMREGATYEIKQIYATLFKQNMAEYHRWRQRKGLEY